MIAPMLKFRATTLGIITILRKTHVDNQKQLLELYTCVRLYNKLHDAIGYLKLNKF